MRKKTSQPVRLLLLPVLFLTLLVSGCGTAGREPKNDPEKTPATKESNEGAEKRNKENSTDSYTVWIMGDSLAAQHKSSQSAGWGTMLPYFAEEGVTIRNAATSGASSSSYVESGMCKNILASLKEGDTVLIQFGHNDSYFEDRFTDPMGASDEPGSFQYILKEEYIKPILEKKCRAVLATSVVALSFTDEHTVGPMLYDQWAEAMRKLAKECNAEGLAVDLIDTYALTKEVYEEIGMQQAASWHNDQVHYNVYGAVRCAEIIAKELEKLGVKGFSDVPDAEEVLSIIANK